jgi:hypothetical protein
MRARALALLLALSACGEGPWEAIDPRDRVGDRSKPATWSLVVSPAGASALLAHPGGAPELVLWCKAGAKTASLRVHSFTAVSGAALILETPEGILTFETPRLQGGLQGSKRALLEVDAPIRAFTAMAQFRLRYADQDYAGERTDPDGAIGRWTQACGGA